MATTGLATSTVTRDQMITRALRSLRVLQEGQSANSQQISDAAETLNDVIAKLQSNGLVVWTYQQIQVTCQQGKNFYTFGPVGADVTCNRPLRLMDGSFIRNIQCPTVTQDTPLRVISRLEYLQFGNKVTQGTPNSVYYDQQFNIASNLTSPSTGFGTLYVYVNPITDQNVLFLNFQRQLYQMDNAGDEFDVPREGFLAIRWCLAEELLDEYEVPLERAQYIMTKAKQYRDDLEDWSVENTPQNWAPDWAFQQRRAFR